MITRRQILLGAATLSAGAGLNLDHAQALSTEPLSPADAEAMALACSGAPSHANLVARARLWLADGIARGLLPAGSGTTIDCPFCRCRLRVGAGGAS